MSLYGALSIGVAGLDAASAALSVSSSNIANVNTVGYKQATASFATYLNSSLGSNSNASAGVTAVIGQDVTQNGLAEPDLFAHRSLDLRQRLLRRHPHRQRHGTAGIYPGRQFHRQTPTAIW